MPDRKPSVRSKAERNALVVQHLDLVPWAIYEKRPRLRGLARLLGHQDAIQVGNVGLIRAAELWKKRAGMSFPGYATKYVRWSLITEANKLLARPLEFLPHLDCCPEGQKASDVERLELRDALFSALRTLTERRRRAIELRYGLSVSGDCLTLEETARRLGVTRERVRQIILSAIFQMGTPRRLVSLSKAVGEHLCFGCQRSTEWDLVCPCCQKSGCHACIRARVIRRGLEPVKCCESCYRVFRSQEPPEGWDGYTPFWLSLRTGTSQRQQEK